MASTKDKERPGLTELQGEWGTVPHPDLYPDEGTVATDIDGEEVEERTARDNHAFSGRENVTKVRGTVDHDKLLEEARERGEATSYSEEYAAAHPSEDAETKSAAKSRAKESS